MRVCGLDYLFAISGAARIVSTEPRDSQRRTLRSFSDHSWASLPSVLYSDLSLQDTQVTFVFGVMRRHRHTLHHHIRRMSTGFHGIAISMTC